MKDPARRIHLVDVENLMGGTGVTPATIDQVIRDYRTCSCWHPGDQMYVGSSRLTFTTSAWQWKSHYPCGWYVKDGRDGGEDAVLQATGSVPLYRFDEIVIGSGDHAFAEVGRRARQAGLTVRVAARRGCVAHDLKCVADHVSYLTDMDKTSPRGDRGSRVSKTPLDLPRYPAPNGRRDPHSRPDASYRGDQPWTPPQIPANLIPHRNKTSPSAANQARYRTGQP